MLGRLPHVFRTENPVLAFAASGSGAMESAVANLVRPGTKALAAASGKFGERWIQLCEAYGADLVQHEPGWGVRFDPADFDRLLSENPGIEVVFATLSARPRPASSTTSRRSPRSCAATARCSSSTPSPASAPRGSSRTRGASTSSSPARRRR